MKIIFSVCALIVLANCNLAMAQAIDFNKKSGEFSSAGKKIGQLEGEREKGLGGRRFYVKDAAGEKVLLSFKLNRWSDLFGSPTIYYYIVDCEPLQLSAYANVFTGSLNLFKEAGEFVAEKQLLSPDGSVNEANMKAYFEEIKPILGNYPEMISKHNDSLAALVTIPYEVVERNKRKEIIVNEYGKIGQGNPVIGTWEYAEKKGPMFHEVQNVFYIRNMVGGIVCVAFISAAGDNTYIFKNSNRIPETRHISLSAVRSPLENKQAYVAYVAEILVKEGVL